MTYRATMIYIKLAQLHMESVILYVKFITQQKTIIGKLYPYFLLYFKNFSALTIESFLLILSVTAMKSANSIRSLFSHFLSEITAKSLNTFYYFCSYAKTERNSRYIIKSHSSRIKIPTIFTVVNNTIFSKFGKKFENIATLFNHAAHNSSNYPKGHCFVSIMLYVPV